MAYEEQIAKGVALLDEKRPGWYLRVNLDALDMAVCETYEVGDCGCVLAQLDYDPERGNGGYPRLARALGLDATFRLRNPPPNHAEHFGFTLPIEQIEAAVEKAADDAGEADATETLFAPLTDAWKATIRRLRAERAGV